MRALLLARHAHASSNADATVSCRPPGPGLSPLGRRQAVSLGAALGDEEIDLGVASELERTRETLALALAGRDVPIVECAGLNEIGFGSFEGGPLTAYRAWAWTAAPDEDCPGGGESRHAAARRFGVALEWLLGRPEEVVLVVGHALFVRYVLDAGARRVPQPRVASVPHADAVLLGRDEVATASRVLGEWSAAGSWRSTDTPFGG